MTSNIMPSTSRDRAALAQFVDKASYMFVGNASRLCFAKWIEEGAASKLGDEIKALHSPLFAAVLRSGRFVACILVYDACFHSGGFRRGSRMTSCLRTLALA